MTAVGFTGSRGEPSAKQFKALHEFIEKHAIDWHSFHHGSCVGFDLAAHRIIQTWPDIKIHVWPPLNRRYKAPCAGQINHTPMGYAQRNLMIVQHADLLIGCPPGPEEDWPKSGTWMTIRMARKLGVPRRIITPDGAVGNDGG